MPDVRSSGIFSDRKSAGGLYRGSYIDGVKIPGIPIEFIAAREVFVVNFDFRDKQNEANFSSLWETIDVPDSQTAGPAIDGTQEFGVMRLNNDGTAGDGISLSLTQDESLASGSTPAAGKIITFETLITCSDWDAVHWFAGLHEDGGGTEILDTNGDLADIQSVGFYYNDDDDVAGIPTLLSAGADDSQIVTAPDVPILAGVDSEFKRFGIRIEGTTDIEYYVNNVKVGSNVLESALDAKLHISFACVANESVADTFDIDYVTTSQTRI